MADLKISALTTASTPLAGTEVFPIVQSGSTKKVSITTLTEGRPVVAINGAAKAWNIPALQITNAALYAIGTETGYYANAYYSSGWKYATAATASGYLQNGGIHQWYASTDAVPVADGAISFGQLASLTSSSGDFKNFNGNYVVGTSGKGIDFSAVASGIKWLVGTGSPESVVTAAPGSLYTNSSGGLLTTLYVKESGTGNTGWVGK